jgi:hypothetical protein
MFAMLDKRCVYRVDGCNNPESNKIKKFPFFLAILYIIPIESDAATVWGDVAN